MQHAGDKIIAVKDPRFSGGSFAEVPALASLPRNWSSRAGTTERGPFADGHRPWNGENALSAALRRDVIALTG